MHYHEVFHRPINLLLVIHCTKRSTTERVIEQVAVAVRGGSHGVFLINHGIPHQQLLGFYEDIRERFRSLWIGLNLLDMAAPEVYGVLPQSVDGVWFDSIGLDEGAGFSPDEALRARLGSGWHGLVFGSVAFKGQTPVKTRQLRGLVREAARFCDVVTTSGPGTGLAAEPEKIRVMRKARGDKPLALASGVTSENISAYLGLGVNCFLVATGVSRSFDELSPRKVQKLASDIRLANTERHHTRAGS